ncbi:MAG: alpha-amylase/4-alpha-glucanotransferase domain-containing protein [bacterium]
MTKFKLAFGLHNHQPVGNFEAVFEEAHRKAYAPFMKLARSFPDIRFSLHQSGILWHWQQRAHPEYFELVGGMVDRGQIELMTGGFYEPILVSVPERDARGQIRMLGEYIQKHFEVTPQGLWLTERIWEPHLPRLLAETGVKYLPIDDTHFLYAGFELSQLKGPFVTEHEGKQVTLLPIQKKLRYLIPFGTVAEVIQELKRQAEHDPEGLAVYADDGEKFGVWPDTHKHCFTDGWLEEFFSALGENVDWLEVVPLERAAEHKSAGRAYLPSASYAEMLQWALPAKAGAEYESFEHWLKESEVLERYGRFVRGGHWRGFLAKYEESNLMHKRMLNLSERLYQLEQKRPNLTGDLADARDRLYAGQCNCPYWHGVFGGLYLPHIRQAIHSSLIKADELLRRVNPDPDQRLAVLDYDLDGYDEVLWSDNALTAVIKPSSGGTLLDLALNRHHFSPTDTLTRRKEAYHLKLDKAVTSRSSADTASIHDLILAKEEGLQHYLFEDWYLKRCFLDHFFTDDVDFERFQSGKFGEEGDFILEPFALKKITEDNQVRLTRDGNLWRPGGKIPVRLIKTFRFEPGQELIEVEYELTTAVDFDVLVKFGVECNFNFQAGHAEDRFVMVDNQRPPDSFLDSSQAFENHHSVTLLDQYRDLGVALDADQPGHLWQSPIFTVSLSEGGFEKVYQGTTIVKVFHLTLSSRPTTLKFTLRAGTLAGLGLNAASAKATHSTR